MTEPRADDAGRGTYLLILEAAESATITVGRLGPLCVRPGFYFYVGSAFGPGGVRARLAHHANIAHRPHWHIDYLRRVAALREAWITHDPRRQEHTWARLLEARHALAVPCPGFGASDCGCRSHLFFSPDLLHFSEFRRHLIAQIPDHAPLLRIRYNDEGNGVA